MFFVFFFFSFQVVRADAKTSKTSSRSSCCKKDDFFVKIRFLALGGQGCAENGPFVDPAFMIFRFFLQSLLFGEKRVSSFFFFQIFFVASINVQSLTVDVSSVVGAPQRCGVLTAQGGIAGIGLGHQPGESARFNSPQWGGRSSPVKTEPLQIVVFLVVVVVVVVAVVVVSSSSK